MATFNIYKLHFTTPLHIGDRREDYGISQKTIASDTLYAALTSCLAKLGKTIPEDGDLGFAVSSTFPYYQEHKEDNPVYFFPKPLYQRMPNLKDLTQAKLIKKVTWLDAKYFEKNLQGEMLFDNNDQEIECIHGVFLSQSAIDKDFICSQVVPRVTVSRNGSDDAKPFYMDRVTFKGYSGLYFIAFGDTSLLDQALNLLSVEGIGTDRNVGNGIFEYEKDAIEINLPTQSNYAISLSLFIPENKEQLSGLIGDSIVAYDFERRGGWITSSPYNSFRKNAIYGFVAGSVFYKQVDDIVSLGRIVDLRPDLEFEKINHPIWRCGKSIFIPFKI